MRIRYSASYGLTRILYRIRQFWQVFRGIPSQEDLQEAQKVLSPTLLALFYRMQASEQTHGLAMFHQFVQNGETSQDLLVAALLHDAGKSRYPLQTMERVLIVLGEAFLPERVKEWGKGQPVSWKKSFVVAVQHPTWGAEMAARAGASALTVALILYHQEPPEIAAGLSPVIAADNHALYLLQSLDNRF